MFFMFLLLLLLLYFFPSFVSFWFLQVQHQSTFPSVVVSFFPLPVCMREQKGNKIHCEKVSKAIHIHTHTQTPSKTSNRIFSSLHIVAKFAVCRLSLKTLVHAYFDKAKHRHEQKPPTIALTVYVHKQLLFIRIMRLRPPVSVYYY